MRIVTDDQKSATSLGPPFGVVALAARPIPRGRFSARTT
jgi:hypothetical protein